MNQPASQGSASEAPADRVGMWDLTNSCCLPPPPSSFCFPFPLSGSGRSPWCARDKRDERPQGKHFPRAFIPLLFQPLEKSSGGLVWGCEDEQQVGQHLRSHVSAVHKDCSH